MLNGHKQLILYPIDKICLTLILVLSIAIAGLIWGEKSCQDNCWFNTGAKVRNFSWSGKTIGAADTAFILTFDRPMDHQSVEENLVIEPSLEGKFSWAGRRLAYTLSAPAPYGETYHLHLRGAREKFRQQAQAGSLIQPFIGNFKTRDRAFAYIGNRGEEQGRLIIYNFTKQQKVILTPPNLLVVDFQFSSTGDRLIFSAADRNLDVDIFRNLQLYRITTGLNLDSETEFSPQMELLLEANEYQNNKFEISADGESIVIQRVNKNNPGDFDLWLLKPGQSIEKLNMPGGEFLITPDSQTLAVAQGEGIGLLPLQPGAKPIDYLPKFGRILSFSPDGSSAAMVNFNVENANLRYTRSLFYVNNQGLEKELININGSIINCQFNHNGTNLYCLLTKVIEGEDYQEQPYFARIDIKNNQVTPLLSLPSYQDIQISYAPDNLGILFDQVITSDDFQSNNDLMTNSGQTIIGGNLWLLIPPPVSSSESTKPQLEELPLNGFRPQWAP